MDIIYWISDNYTLQDKATGVREPCMPIILAYIHQQASAIKAYKNEAEKRSILGSDSALHCSEDKLAGQLAMAIKIFPAELVQQQQDAPISDTQFSSLAWKGVTYELCHDEVLHRSEC
jgi:hypothetical protein